MIGRALAAAVAVAVVAAPALARDRAKIQTSQRQHRLEKTEDTVEGGTHWRIRTDEGAVHVWIPPGYDRATAGTVVYVHGYYTDADGAWRDYHLARQFRRSHQNALFVVPDAPSGNGEEVKWPALTDLRRALARANIRIPDGPIIVMGHSGAFRTVMKWTDHHLVEQIILLDALYGGEHAFDAFVASGKYADRHKMIVVGASTATESRAFAKKYPFAVVRENMPGEREGFSKRERRAKLLYIRSQYGHMEIVTSGKVIPRLLHLTHLAEIGHHGGPVAQSRKVEKVCGLLGQAMADPAQRAKVTATCLDGAAPAAPALAPAQP